MSWAEIDLGAIRSNVAGIRGLLSPKTMLMAVVKANAYGHGMLPVARVCLEEGADYLGVANPLEALELRKAGIDSPVLVLGYTPADCADLMVENQVDVTVFDMETALFISQAAVRLNRQGRVHVKIDTGMGRIGLRPDGESIGLMVKMADLPGITLQGLFSHLATADDADKSFAYYQLQVFQEFSKRVEEAGVLVPIKHLANSAAIMEMPETHFDMVRAGIITYGLYPSDEVDKSRLSLIPAMRLKSRITQVKCIPPGHSVSYGRTYVSQRATKVATVPIGYADGYSRLLSNRGRAAIRGQIAPLIGRVCMDQCMFDVSALEQVEVGDEVILFGTPQDGITADDLAHTLGTINYEIVCAPHSRIVRTYIE